MGPLRLGFLTHCTGGRSACPSQELRSAVFQSAKRGARCPAQAGGDRRYCCRRPRHGELLTVRCVRAHSVRCALVRRGVGSVGSFGVCPPSEAMACSRLVALMTESRCDNLSTSSVASCSLTRGLRHGCPCLSLADHVGGWIFSRLLSTCPSLGGRGKIRPDNPFYLMFTLFTLNVMISMFVSCFLGVLAVLCHRLVF